MEQGIILFIIIFVAAFLQSGIGFGFAIVVMSILPSILDYSKAVGVQQAIGLIACVYIAIKYFNKIKLKTWLPLAIPTVTIGAILTYYVSRLKSGLLFIALGAVLVLISIYFLTINNNIHFKASAKSGFILGCVAGVGNGLFGIAGPPLAIYFLNSTEDNEEYIASIQSIFLFSTILNIIARVMTKSLVFEDVPVILLGWVAMFLGTFLGLKVLKRIETGLLKKIIYAFIGLNGIWIILSHTII